MKQLNSLFLVFLSTSACSAGLVVNDAYIAENGNIITGVYTGTSTSPAISIQTKRPVIILNSTVSGPGDLISAYAISGSQISVLYTLGMGQNPNLHNVQKGIFVKVRDPQSFEMRNCNASNVRLGLYLNGYSGNHTHTQTIRLITNNFTNIDGRPSNGKSGYAKAGQYNGQAFHLQNVNHLPGIEIAWNSIINSPGQSCSGALIEFNEVSGTSSEPFLIHDNFISGALPAWPGVDQYDFGGILMNGLYNDSSANVTAYGNIYNNVITATANYGIAVIAGNNIRVYNNRVVSSGYTASGTFYMKPKYGNPFAIINDNLYGQTSNVFYNNYLSNNVVGLVANVNGSPTRQDWDLLGQALIEGNTSYSPSAATSPTYANEQTEYTNWLARLSI